MLGWVAAGEGDGVAVAAQPGVDPEDVDDVLVRRGLGGVAHGFPPVVVVRRALRHRPFYDRVPGV